MARLDRLPQTREIAQLGAVLGREFVYELLQAVAPLDEATLQAGLAQLVAAELLSQRGQPPRARYMFKHALIQDAAYASLLRSTRQRYQQRMAQLLEAQLPRGRRDTARAAGPALYRRGLPRAGSALLAAGRPTRQRPLGPSGSRQPLHHRASSCSRPCQRRLSIPSRRLDAAHRPRRSARDDQRACSA